MNGGGGAALAAVGQGEAQRAAEGLAVEAAFGMGPQAQAAHDLVGVQRSPLTSARGEGAALSGARQGAASATRFQNDERPVGQAEVLHGPRSRAGRCSAGRCRAAPGGAAPWRS